MSNPTNFTSEYHPTRWRVTMNPENFAECTYDRLKGRLCFDFENAWPDRIESQPDNLSNRTVTVVTNPKEELKTEDLKTQSN